MALPFENDTQTIIKKLAKRRLQQEKRHNGAAILALILTTLMITATFSQGMSYFATYQMQQIRLLGTTADVAITDPTEAQLSALAHSALVHDVGILQRLGSIDTASLPHADLGLVWLDEDEWLAHRLPTISNVIGDYPTQAKEVMLPTWVLAQMGIDRPQLGQAILLTYQIGERSDEISDTFYLSGYYTDYMMTRTDWRGYVYVSTAFQETLDLTPNYGISAMLRLRDDSDVAKICAELKQQIPFTAQQNFEIVPTGATHNSTLTFAVLFLAMAIAFSGYLLIYNIFYISVVKDVQFFGRLKTLGATAKQIKRLIAKQVTIIAMLGIPAGLLLGAIISFAIVPYALQMLYADRAAIGTSVSFSPFIFGGAALLAFMTAQLAAQTPAKIASRISPIATLGYADVRANAHDKRSHRFRLMHMAWHNVFRSGKSAALVLASLFSGMVTFFLVIGLLKSVSAENFASQWGESDFALTYSIHQSDDLITSDLVEAIRQLPGVHDIRLTYAPATQIFTDVRYDDHVFHDFLLSLDGKSGIDLTDSDQLARYQQNFYSGIYGIDGAYLAELAQTLDNPIDMTAFAEGELVLLTEMVADDGTPLILPGEKISVATPDGEKAFTVAPVFLAADFQSSRGKGRGTAPDLYISQQALKHYFPQYRIFRIAFDTDGKQDAALLDQLKRLTAAQPDINILSRYEKRIEISDYLLTARILGGWISLILLLIGIMNFINTMTIQVHTRRYELALLESIGMTKKQIRRMLMLEGGYYWAITFLLVLTIGTAIYIPLYGAFRQMAFYATLAYPLLPLIFIALLALGICLLTPVWVYRTDSKNTVVERLRDQA